MPGSPGLPEGTNLHQGQLSILLAQVATMSVCLRDPGKARRRWGKGLVLSPSAGSLRVQGNPGQRKIHPWC